VRKLEKLRELQAAPSLIIPSPKYSSLRLIYESLIRNIARPKALVATHLHLINLAFAWKEAHDKAELKIVGKISPTPPEFEANATAIGEEANRQFAELCQQINRWSDADRNKWLAYGYYAFNTFIELAADRGDFGADALLSSIIVHAWTTIEAVAQ
jgi:hypothetical protein